MYICMCVYVIVLALEGYWEGWVEVWVIAGKMEGGNTGICYYLMILPYYNCNFYCGYYPYLLYYDNSWYFNILIIL